MGKKQYTYAYPRPAVTVDTALFTMAGEAGALRLQALLIQRASDPFAGAWALPGGFVDEHEDLRDAALRELREETGVREGYLEQVGAVGTPGRDPRGHTITVLYVALVPGGRHAVAGGDDAREARWFAVEALPPLAFDHAALLAGALRHLRRRVLEASVLLDLLPEAFKLDEMQGLAEAVLGRPLDRREFRRRVRDGGLVAAVEKGKAYRFVPGVVEAYRARQGPF
jgi:8-oxo-dGTP diphosphatase